MPDYEDQAANEPRVSRSNTIGQEQDYSSHVLEVRDGPDYVLDLRQWKRRANGTVVHLNEVSPDYTGQ